VAGVWQTTDDGTTEVTSCGSRTSEQGSSCQHHRQQQQQQQTDSRQRPALIAGEMSQYERASYWVDNLPTESNDATAPAAGAGTRDQSQSGDSRSTIVRGRDGAQDTNHSSRSVSCDDTK